MVRIEERQKPAGAVSRAGPYRVRMAVLWPIRLLIEGRVAPIGPSFE